MSRLLFAAARGARIEYTPAWAPLDSGFFEAVDTIPLDTKSWYRVHPDDAHLQYGPISTAVRDSALYDANAMTAFGLPELLEFWFPDLHDAIIRTEDGADTEERMMLLLWAEMLADEGL